MANYEHELAKARSDAANEMAGAILTILTVQMNMAKDKFLDTGDVYWKGRNEALCLALKLIADLKNSLDD